MHCKILSFFTLKVLLLSSVCTSFAKVNEALGFISDLHQFVGADCIYFASSESEVGLNEQRKMLRMVVYFNTRSIRTRTLDLRSMHEEPFSANCVQPLIVMLINASKELIQLSAKISLTGPTWLMIVEEESVSLDESFLGINLPFDCEFIVALENSFIKSYILIEVYRVADGTPLQQSYYGSWNMGEGLRGPNKLTFYNRRNNLNGLTLRGLLVDDPALHWGKIEASTLVDPGIYGDIWRVLRERMNFTCVVKIVPRTPRTWELPGKNDKWGGIVGMLVEKEVDVHHQGLIITSERAAVVDYSIPLSYTTWKMFVRKPTEPESSFYTFLAPFSSGLWIGLFVSALITAIFVAQLYRIERDFGSGEERYPLKDAIFQTFGAIFCQQGHAQTPRSVACRIIHLFVHMMGLFVINCYAGILTSSLTVFVLQLPFNNLQGLYDDGQYELGTIDNSNLLKYFQTTQDTLSKNLYSKFMANSPKNLPTSVIDGFSRVCKHKYAFIAPLTAYAGFTKSFCEMYYFAETFETSPQSMAFVKNSPYLGLINHNLVQMIDKGIIKRFREMHKSIPTSSGANDGHASIGAAAVRPLHSLMALGVISATVLFILETIIFTIKSRKKTPVDFHPISYPLARIPRKMRVVKVNFKRKIGKPTSVKRY